MATIPPTDRRDPDTPTRRRPRRSRAWVVVGSILSIPVLVWSVFQVVLMIAHEEVRSTEVVPARGIGSIEVRNPTGRVEIVGADVDEITIHAEVDHGLRRTGHGHRTEGDRLIVWGTCPIVGSSYCEVSYRIEVPADIAVEVRSAERLVLQSLDGPVEARLSNARIDADGLRGPTVLRSTNDDIRVIGHRSDDLEVTSSNGDVWADFGEAPRHVEARSTNGDVSLFLPRDDEIRYAVTVESRNGDRTNELVTDSGSDRVIVARSGNGDAMVRYR